MIKLMARVFTLTLMALDTRVNGLRISNTDMVLKDGQMVPHTKANILKAKSTEEVNLRGLMLVLSLEISRIITFMVVESMNGLMEEFTLVIGKTTRWKVTEPSHGLMEENTLVNTLTT